MTTINRYLVFIPLISCCAGMAKSAETIEGFTEPYRTVQVSVSEPGIITELAVEPGRTVQKGDRLLALDTSVLEATLTMAKQKAASTGSVDVAKAELQLRDERLTQIRQLRQRGHATHRELSRAQADLEIAKARLKLATEDQALNELDCRRIQAQIDRRRVKSPYTGVIAEVHREVGEALLITEPQIVTLVQLSRLRSRFPANPSQAARLRVNQRVRLLLPDTNEALEGSVERIAPVMDAKSGTIEVQVLIDNADRRWRSGSRCLLEVDSSAKSNNALAVSPLSTR